ncbi:MAG: hypothetical protein A2452_09915 [Candidatus Firestonebacteria bacterium RIFOXYC2_FULL_39_67]|nr:MAG: hypothetical protein A2536_04225 [Candidatus Firestonebacteria bacterium RIFOXYD2_FULL_39_29]OGF55109.1 MAG: hypothetical protein A2452_09915 [Candidatus Firestonebacteria bacterium RIFOXYC2_FULL_39_67]OGF57818.1 MAG: hypothetical protein A2497_06520 [Candidatus Firestonebacteria bacterium RifOxyC12_full_39_7]
MHLEYINCPLCDRDDYKIMASRKDGQKIVKCRNCGLVYVNPRYSEESLKKLYDGEGSIHGEISGKIDYKTFLENEFYGGGVAQLNLVKKYKLTGKLLDIGIGGGQFAYAAANNGFNVTGTDLSMKAVANAKSRYGMDIKNGKVEELKLKTAEYDVVTLWSVLEHVVNPLQVLKEANKLLKQDGVLFGYVPNINGLSSRYKNLTALVKNEDRKYGHFGLPYHIVLFTKNTLRQMSDLAGFKVVEIEYWSSIRQNSKKLNLAQKLTANILEKTKMLDYFAFAAVKK